MRNSKISKSPDSALINIRTLRRPDVDHQACAMGGDMRNSKISKSPDSALINIRTLWRPDVDHRACAMGGDMRNSKYERGLKTLWILL